MTRPDDIINLATHRLSTGEVEEVLAAHPDVADCAVFEVADALKGQAPLAESRHRTARRRDRVKSRPAPARPRPGRTSRRRLSSPAYPIAEGEDYALPATIADPPVLTQIAKVPATVGYAGR